MSTLIFAHEGWRFTLADKTLTVEGGGRKRVIGNKTGSLGSSDLTAFGLGWIAAKNDTAMIETE